MPILKRTRTRFFSKKHFEFGTLSIFAAPTKPPTLKLMKPDHAPLQNAFRRRETELYKIIKQMKDDKLDTSTVYKKLEEELKHCQNQTHFPIGGEKN